MLLLRLQPRFFTRSFSGCDIKIHTEHEPAFREAEDILGALRAATGKQHEVLDSRMPLALVTRGHAPHLRYYRDHLRLLRVWLAPLEQWLAQFSDGPQARDEYALVAPPLPAAMVAQEAGPFPVPPFIARTPLLEIDLAHPAMPASSTALVITDQSWPAQATPAYRWGVCYVIEGSQLGGAMLYKRLAGALSPHPLRYLLGEGPPGPRWQAFQRALRAQVQSPEEMAQACAGAGAAFDRLLELLAANPAIAAAPGEAAAKKEHAAMAGAGGAPAPLTSAEVIPVNAALGGAAAGPSAAAPSLVPPVSPSLAPSVSPSIAPSIAPSVSSSVSPSIAPSVSSSVSSSVSPSIPTSAPAPASAPRAAGGPAKDGA